LKIQEIDNHNIVRERLNTKRKGKWEKGFDELTGDWRPEEKEETKKIHVVFGGLKKGQKEELSPNCTEK